MEPAADITRLLDAVRDGTDGAHEALYQRLHNELHALARQHMRDERRGHTLQPTAVIHEAWIRLFSGHPKAEPYAGRSHFMRTASRAMRHVLIDHARRRLADKRDQRAAPVPTEVALQSITPDPAELLAVHEALEQLKVVDKAQAAVVEMRYFGGLGMAEIGELLGISERTVKRRWAFARAWLFREIGGPEPGAPDGGRAGSQ